MRQAWHRAGLSGGMKRDSTTSSGGQSGAAVGDTLFVELADREGVPLVTFDARLIRAWPKLCVRPRDC